MSTSDSIVSSQTKQSSWRKSDNTWTLGLFGTAIGAGVLFFPIRAGFGGLIPILLLREMEILLRNSSSNNNNNLPCLIISTST